MAEIGNKENDVGVEGFNVDPFGMCSSLTLFCAPWHIPLGVWCCLLVD